MNSLKSICAKWVHGMASKVTFEDYTIEVKGIMDDGINAVLEECAGELESQVKRNSRVASSKTKNSFRHKVVDSEHKAYIGSDEENAIWEEFGTGEHAIPEGGGGRQGYWVFVKGSENKSKKTGKSYTLEEAKKVMAILRKKGLDAYYTNGKRPSRAFWNAYTALKSKIINRIQEYFKGL